MPDRETILSLLSHLGAIFAIAIGVVCSLMLFTLFLAGGANQDAAGLRMIKRLTRATALGGAAAAIGGIALLTYDHAALAAAVGLLPAAVLLGFMIWTR